MARPRSNTRVTVEGDSNCKHVERLDKDGHKGICSRCGRTKIYSDGEDYTRSLQSDFSFQTDDYWHRLVRNGDIGVKTW